MGQFKGELNQNTHIVPLAVSERDKQTWTPQNNYYYYTTYLQEATPQHVLNSSVTSRDDHLYQHYINGSWKKVANSQYGKRHQLYSGWLLQHPSYHDCIITSW